VEPRHGPSFFPVVALLIVGLIAFYPALKKLPLVEELVRVTPEAKVEKPWIKVWVNKRSGLYHCPGTEFYGKEQPGFYATQREAVQSGYRPARGEPCR
jgi:hypothetical protein